MIVKDRIDLADYFAKLGFKVGAEVGVAKGRYSQILCEKIPGLKLYCIDPWTPYKGNSRGGGNLEHHENFKIAQERLGKYDVIFIHTKSMEALYGVSDRGIKIEDGSLDFVFIDANHDFDYVLEDIIGWSRKVRVGGIVSGHDYYQFVNSGVIEAVSSYVNFHRLDLNLTLRNSDNVNRDDKAPCWWFYKGVPLR